LRRLFTEHPATVGETYLQHMAMAVGFAGRMFAAGLACLLHAFLPFLFVKTGSNAILALHDRMVMNRARPSPPAEAMQVRGAD
jgi:hypothetical protein